MKKYPILSAGVDTAPDDALRRKVFMTNTIAILLGGALATPFIAVSYIFVPILTWMPIAGALITFTCPLFNHMGYYNLSRLNLGIVASALAGGFQMGLTQKGEDPVISIYMIQLVLGLLPFLIFRLREVQWLFSALLISFLIMMAHPITTQWYEVEVDNSFFKTGVFKDLVLGAGIVIGYFIIYVSSRLSQDSEDRAHQLLEGMDSANQQLRQSEDKMRQQVEELEQARQHEAQRQWAAEGESALMKVLRTEHDESRLYDALLQQLVRYIGLNQGALYLTISQEGQEYLELAACYAWGRKKFLHQRLLPGQGLAGQAWLEKEMTYLEEVPPNYINVTSGLGEALPTAIIIVPMIQDGKVEGIIELASFKPFQPHHQTFLQNIGEMMATSLRNQRVNIRNQELLMQSQEKESLLREQEEQMRHSLEELEATQEEMKRREIQYKKQITQLKEAIHQNNMDTSPTE